ncbi:MAG TPA: hypothetical protein VGB17_16495 [Pyrinomonadaceae bacterium]|jgi:hypothetical protein
MNLTQLLGKAAGHNALLTLFHLGLEEIHLIVPTNNSSNIQQLNDRTIKLETKLDTTYEMVQKLEGKVDELRKELEAETSLDRTVTWKPLLWLLGLMVTSTLVVAGFLYKEMLPEKIEIGISNSTSLAKSFGGFNKHLDELDGALKEIRNEVAEMRNDIRGLADSKFISAALKDAVSGDKASLAKRLPDVKRLTHQIATLKVPLPDRDYREISKPLAHHYNSSKPPLKHQLWEVLVELANARSSTEAITHPLSETEIAEARAAGKYVENADVDLSEKTNWEEVIFKNCKIRISKPENNLTLNRVQFIECRFQLEVESGPSQNLLKAILENNGSQISATIAQYMVLPPVYHKENQ